MKSAELSSVLSAFRDWYEANSHPGAGPSRGQRPDSCNLFVSAMSECDLSAEEMQFIKNVIDENVCTYFLAYSKVDTVCWFPYALWKVRHFSYIEPRFFIWDIVVKFVHQNHENKAP